jgi:hypothetical protein
VTAFLTVATGVLAQERYRSPDEAVAALVDAMRNDALQEVMRVLGPGSDEILRSGDPVDDAATRRRFLDAFEAKYQILPDGEDQAVLIVGEERWPFPIRLVRLNNTWRFDAQRASSEVIYRRIGRNEMSAIDACGVYVAAQKEYAEKGVAGKGVYARRFISRPGERDGLYWPAPSGEDESPLDEFATSSSLVGRANTKRNVQGSMNSGRPSLPMSKRPLGAKFASAKIVGSPLYVAIGSIAIVRASPSR